MTFCRLSVRHVTTIVGGCALLVALAGDVASGQTVQRQSASTSKTTTPSRAPSKTTGQTTSKGRQVKPTRARTAPRAPVVRESQIPRYKVDATGAVVPDLRAAAAIIYNPETRQVLWEENSQDKRSIASITKVMTAVVFLEDNPDLASMVTIERSDTYAASTTYLRPGYSVSVRDLMHLLLIASDNAAARALARISPWGPAGFVARMNEKATELGLQNTAYADPSGLDAANVSTAYDMARLIAYAATDERISGIMRKPDHSMLVGRRVVTIHSTNLFLTRSEMEGSVLGGKTGFIARAGYCLATLFRLPQLNQQVAVVVLGAHSSTGRFTEVRNLLGWLSSRTQTAGSKKDVQ